MVQGTSSAVLAEDMAECMALLTILDLEAANNRCEACFASRWTYKIEDQSMETSIQMKIALAAGQA
jgi:hypothetical protein